MFYFHKLPRNVKKNIVFKDVQIFLNLNQAS